MGPPKKFTTDLEERKISWLELFYDLVYVIAIAKITHHFGSHLSYTGLLDYCYFFGIIFWSWLNGSLYHDLHESSGLRTKLMTMWQMLIVAALVVAIESIPEKMIFNVTIVIMIMQFYITYLWWSVGIYDREHRRLNMPYTIIYLLSLSVMFASLFMERGNLRLMMCLSLCLNYLPPFISHQLLKKRNMQLSLSASMSERLGLFTIILFGEVIAGIINGISEMHELSLSIWTAFGLSVMITFALWWIFFTLISDRKCKPGFVNSSLLEIIFIPTLIALGLISMAFSGLFAKGEMVDHHFLSYEEILGYGLSLFIIGINTMSFFLEFAEHYDDLKKNVQKILWLFASIIAILTYLNLHLGLIPYLLLMLIIIVIFILILNGAWYRLQAQRENNN